jgi:hypothetical protein
LSKKKNDFRKIKKNLKKNLHIKNKSCKIHTIRKEKKTYNKNQQKRKIKEKDTSVLGGRDLFCATKRATMKERK